jgi:exo-beta-1,3-glucanase (GH17 family)
MYHEALHAGNGKSNHYWKQDGLARQKALKTLIQGRSTITTFINTQIWSQEENIDIFYFSSFDESWKVGDRG